MDTEAGLYSRGFVSVRAQDYDTTVQFINKLIFMLSNFTRTDALFKLIFIGFKGAIDSRRCSRRTLKQISFSDERCSQILSEYTQQIEYEIMQLCDTAELHIDKILNFLGQSALSNLPAALSNMPSQNLENVISSAASTASPESSKNSIDQDLRGEIFKFRGDLHRYISEINEDPQHIQKAGIFYEKAKQGFATNNYVYTAVCLNQAIFMYEILQEKKAATELLRKVLASVDKSTTRNSLLINMIQENLQLWSTL